MASSLHCSVSLPSSLPKLSNFNFNTTNNKFFSFNPSSNSNSNSNPISTIKCSASSFSSFSSTSLDETAMSIENLRSFINLNIGKWNGSFYQFDAGGNLLQRVSTKLSVSSYGEDELMSLIQSLYIKQPSSNTSVSGDDDDAEWAEYKIKETNMFTVDKYQQFADRLFPIRESICIEVSNSWYVGNCITAGGSWRR